MLAGDLVQRAAIQRDVHHHGGSWEHRKNPVVNKESRLAMREPFRNVQHRHTNPTDALQMFVRGGWLVFRGLFCDRHGVRVDSSSACHLKNAFAA